MIFRFTLNFRKKFDHKNPLDPYQSHESAKKMSQHIINSANSDNQLFEKFWAILEKQAGYDLEEVKEAIYKSMETAGLFNREQTHGSSILPPLGTATGNQKRRTGYTIFHTQKNAELKN